MCELSGKLIAWLDRELENDEMAHVQQHIQDCIECRSQLDAYQAVSRTFDGYRDAVMASMTRRRELHWVPVLSVAATLAFALAAFLVFRHTRVEALVPPISVKTDPAAVVLETAAVPKRRGHRRNAPMPVKNRI